jgi:hypothetical protein
LRANGIFAFKQNNLAPLTRKSASNGKADNPSSDHNDINVLHITAHRI